MLFCWFHRSVKLLADESTRSLSSVTRRHLAHCPRCRSHLEEHAVIERRLTRESLTNDRQSTPFLTGRIVSAIRRGAEPRVGGLLLRWRWLTTVAGVFAVFAIFYWRSSPHVPQDSAINLPIAKSKVSQSLLPPLTVAVRMESLREWANQVEEPLNQEMRLMMDDTRNAVAMLAQSFLPSERGRE